MQNITNLPTSYGNYSPRELPQTQDSAMIFGRLVRSEKEACVSSRLGGGIDSNQDYNRMPSISGFINRESSINFSVKSQNPNPVTQDHFLDLADMADLADMIGLEDMSDLEDMAEEDIADLENMADLDDLVDLEKIEPMLLNNRITLDESKIGSQWNNSNVNYLPYTSVPQAIPGYTAQTSISSSQHSMSDSRINRPYGFTQHAFENQDNYQQAHQAEQRRTVESVTVQQYYRLSMQAVLTYAEEVSQHRTNDSIANHSYDFTQQFPENNQQQSPENNQQQFQLLDALKKKTQQSPEDNQQKSQLLDALKKKAQQSLEDNQQKAQLLEALKKRKQHIRAYKKEEPNRTYNRVYQQVFRTTKSNEQARIAAKEASDAWRLQNRAVEGIHPLFKCYESFGELRKEYVRLYKKTEPNKTYNRVYQQVFRKTKDNEQAKVAARAAADAWRLKNNKLKSSKISNLVMNESVTFDSDQQFSNHCKLLDQEYKKSCARAYKKTEPHKTYNKVYQQVYHETGDHLQAKTAAKTASDAWRLKNNKPKWGNSVLDWV